VSVERSSPRSGPIFVTVASISEFLPANFVAGRRFVIAIHGGGAVLFPRDPSGLSARLIRTGKKEESRARPERAEGKRRKGREGERERERERMARASLSLSLCKKGALRTRRNVVIDGRGCARGSFGSNEECHRI